MHYFILFIAAISLGIGLYKTVWNILPFILSIVMKVQNRTETLGDSLLFSIAWALFWLCWMLLDIIKA